MSQMFGSVGGRKLTDKEIAEDILTGQKYMLNYYYAPAMLEASANDLRSTFQHVHNNKQNEAKQVFDYLNSKGWYRVRQADNQAMNDLRNTAQEARQILASIGPSGGMIGRQTGWTGVSPGVSQAYSPGGFTGQQGPERWTGTQAGEGQSGYGPSSLSQGARWGGQPSQMGTGTYGGSQWTGTQAGEGQSGYGPSSLSQGARWGGQPSQMGTGTYGGSQWTGTQAGEGQSGYGPSSLSQGAGWGGQPSQMSSSQTGSWSQQGHHSGVQESVTLPSWTRGSNIPSESERPIP